MIINTTGPVKVKRQSKSKQPLKNLFPSVKNSK